ncbi:MAG: DMT family transporter [Oscillospiraceae bacterium]|jgi:transporter family-2 protein|nr:DMT family transporter [Oscillospiraceae bacterium]
MLGVIFSLIAGAAMSFQGVMNTRLGEKTGLFEGNLYVQGTAFLLSIVAFLIMREKGFAELSGVPKPYLLGGVLGLVITVSVMLGIKGLSPTISISIILIAQLLVAGLIDTFGLLGAEKQPLIWQRIAGLALMIGGMLLVKHK